jgi:hypothetical protein
MRLLANQRGTPQRFPHDGYDEIHKKAVAGPGIAVDKSRLLASCPDFGAGPLVWVCPGCPRREGLHLGIPRSEWLGPEVRLVGAPIVAYRQGNRSQPALAGYQHLGWL